MNRTEELLFEAATPEVYLSNPFRLARLPVTAGEREVARRRRELEGAARLQVPVPPEAAPFPPLPDGMTVDPTEVVRQLNALSDPGRRLIRELFWLWPRDFGPSGADPALEALERGWPVVALDLWRREAGRGDPLALHNLAVLHHMLALDYEAAAARRRLGADELRVGETHWQLGLEAWGRLFDHAGFWDLTGELVRRKADPRIDRNFTADLRARLADALALINGRLLVRFAAARADTDFNRHRRLLGRGFPARAKEFALNEAARPLMEELKGVLASQLPPETLASGGVPALAGALAGIEEGPLGVIDIVLPPGNLLRQTAHAEVVERMLDGLKIVTDRRPPGPGELNAVRMFLQRLRALAEEPHLRDRVDRHLQSLPWTVYR